MPRNPLPADVRRVELAEHESFSEKEVALIRIGFMKALVTANPEAVRSRIAGWDERIRKDADALMAAAGLELP